jgi:hypothetical protein
MFALCEHRVKSAKYATDPQYAFLPAMTAGQSNVAQAIALARQEVPNAMA